MCRRWLDAKPCTEFRCPHNLFWEQWRLNLNKIHMTNKASEIRNCCCFINEPWTPEEIGDIWGLPENGIRQCEALAWRKVQKECSYQK
jgi:DNA-directed RNA polymerase sigma subunit (sigma70/sigma32)